MGYQTLAYRDAFRGKTTVSVKGRGQSFSFIIDGAGEKEFDHCAKLAAEAIRATFDNSGGPSFSSEDLPHSSKGQ